MKNTVNEAALPGLKALDRLVGTWKISGGANGRSTFEWMEGGFFLVQHSTMEFQDHEHHVLEIIGNSNVFGAENPEEITSHSYTDTGELFNYTYEVEGDTLTIWRGSKGSSTFSRSTFSEDNNTLTGAWEWPGGSFAFVMTRVLP